MSIFKNETGFGSCLVDAPRVKVVAVCDFSFFALPFALRSSGAQFESALVLCVSVLCFEFQITTFRAGYTEDDFNRECGVEL